MQSVLLLCWLQVAFSQRGFEGSSILTGQPEVWTRAARLNEGGP